MRAIETIVALAAITATATAIQPHANAAFLPTPIAQALAFTYPEQFWSVGYVFPSASDEYSSQTMAYAYPPLPQSSGPFQFAPPGDTNTSESPTEPLEQASLAQPEQVPPAQPEEASPAGTETVPLAPPENVSLAQPEKQEFPASTRKRRSTPEHHASLTPLPQMDLPRSKSLTAPIVRIGFGVPVLAPMSHTFFCLKYANDCEVQKSAFRDEPVTLTAQRWAEIARVNTSVNHGISPQRNTQGLAGEKWLIAPKAGECHDYAVTKRHNLLALGWPARALLLAEVETGWGEHHLVLVIRTSDGDFVADNLNPNIRSWSKAPYQWVRIQSPDNPVIWAKVSRSTVVAKLSGVVNPRL